VVSPSTATASHASDNSRKLASVRIDYTKHTPYSDPGRYASLFDSLPTEPAELSGIAGT